MTGNGEVKSYREADLQKMIASLRGKLAARLATNH